MSEEKRNCKDMYEGFMLFADLAKRLSDKADKMIGYSDTNLAETRALYFLLHLLRCTSVIIEEMVKEKKISST